MNEVRIFTRVHAAGLKPNLALLFINFIDRANDPIALSDLVLQFAGLTIVQVEVVPTIAFRRPDEFPPIVQFVSILLSSVPRVWNQGTIINERGRLFRDHRPRFGCRRVNFDYAVELMPALVVFKRKSAAVFSPYRV